jgi:hypothetical protein
VLLAPSGEFVERLTSEALPMRLSLRYHIKGTTVNT